MISLIKNIFDKKLIAYIYISLSLLFFLENNWNYIIKLIIICIGGFIQFFLFSLKIKNHLLIYWLSLYVRFLIRKKYHIK